MNGKQVLVAGAGLAGSLAAIHFAQLGHRVEIHERRPDPRGAGTLPKWPGHFPQPNGHTSPAITPV
ncbi:NAD(P)-binding protein, partial [Amycolatopsis sp. NPDC000746]|uniref:NAD(P)-binding protein n=1 Tax=Amycolatopsis sp. NPDC000746 TaxID=3154270 RepID=UPI003319C858